jgi:hypothetical protein
LRRKSGDRPDARQRAFPAAQGEPESFLIRVRFKRLRNFSLTAKLLLLSLSFGNRSIDPLFNVLDEFFLLHAEQALHSTCAAARVL